MPDLHPDEKTEERLKVAAADAEAAEAKRVENADAVAETTKKLEQSTQEKLDSIFETTPAEEDPDPDRSTPDEDPADKKDEESDSTLDVKDKGGEEKAAEEKGEVADTGGEKKELPPLSDAYVRAAIHNGWTEKDIEDAYEANPELTIRTLGKNYEAVNRSSREFASHGRAAKAAAEAPVVKPEEKATEKKPEFKGIDLASLEAEYKDDPILGVIKAQNEQSKQLFDTVQELKAAGSARTADQPSDTSHTESLAIARETAAIQQQIEGFFVSGEAKDYDDFYGKLPKDATDWKALTPGQQMNRWGVVEMMDQMLYGAKAQGREMKVDEAMRLAHLSVTEPIREKVIRKELMAKIEKRAKSLSLKPSASAKAESTKPETQQELVDVTQRRLNKVFNG